MYVFSTIILGQAQPQQPHITPGTRPRGRPAKKDTSKKFEEKESSDKEEEPVEEEEDVEDSEKKAVTSGEQFVRYIR